MQSNSDKRLVVGDRAYLRPDDKDGGQYLGLMTHVNGRVQVRRLAWHGTSGAPRRATAIRASAQTIAGWCTTPTSRRATTYTWPTCTVSERVATAVGSGFKGHGRGRPSEQRVCYFPGVVQLDSW